MYRSNESIFYAGFHYSDFKLLMTVLKARNQAETTRAETTQDRNDSWPKRLGAETTRERTKNFCFNEKEHEV